jgi:hypothetical protein
MTKGIMVVPYRDRAEHLAIFLEKQKEHDIIVVEQENGKLFNRGKLLNIGFSESQAYDYFIFHDVDMIPIYADYKPSISPCHLATKCEQFNYQMPCRDYFGGVVIMSKKHFSIVNGFPNEFWGWGAEDDELRKRVVKAKLRITHRNCRFASLKHDHNKVEEVYQKNLDKLKSPIDYNDGLNTLTYNIIQDSSSGTVRHIVVSI